MAERQGVEGAAAAGCSVQAAEGEEEKEGGRGCGKSGAQHPAQMKEAGMGAGREGSYLGGGNGGGGDGLLRAAGQALWMSGTWRCCIHKRTVHLAQRQGK